MLGQLKRWLDRSAVEAVSGDRAARRRLSVAALLVELARADHDEKAAELGAIEALLARSFSLAPDEVRALLHAAGRAVDDAVSLREFTAHLHEELAEPDKLAIIAMLWDVALEDSELDKYEQYLIDKVAELLYVPRGDVMRLRHQAMDRRRLQVPPTN